MDIERLIADETARERALYERVKAAEREMEPFKRRYETLRSEWSEAYNQVKTLTKMRELLTAHTAETLIAAANDIPTRGSRSVQNRER